MKNITFFILVLVSFNFTLKVSAQPSWFPQPPADGPYTENSDTSYSNWTKDTLKSDNFNNLSKWYAWDECDSSALRVGFGQAPCFPEGSMVNIKYDSSISSNVLVLSVDTCYPTGYCYNHNYYSCGVIPTDHYISGVISSNAFSTGYGYYEANMKLPGWKDTLSPSGQCGDGFHPSFWMHGGGTCVSNEVDIMEPGGGQYTYANFNEAGFHDYKPPCWSDCSNCACGDNFCPTDTHNLCFNRQSYKVARAQMTSDSALNLGYHNFAVEFLSDRIIFYFDYQPYKWMIASECMATVDSQITHAFAAPATYPMTVIFGNAVDYTPGTFNTDSIKERPGNINFPPPSPDTTWSMSVDYFYYWTLKEDCSANPVIASDSALSSFYFAVKQTITFDDSTGTTTIPATGPMNNLTFRATDEIDIKPGFEAPAGCTLDLMITPCN